MSNNGSSANGPDLGQGVLIASSAKQGCWPGLSARTRCWLRGSAMNFSPSMRLVRITMDRSPRG